MKTGLQMIADERFRQIAEEGFSSAHDDCHTQGELARAAICYAGRRFWAFTPADHPPHFWPFESIWWNYSEDETVNLAKAGALIAAEIDRRQRAEQAAGRRIAEKTGDSP